MTIIRFSDEEVFGTDSQEYEILVNAVAKVENTEVQLLKLAHEEVVLLK